MFACYTVIFVIITYFAIPWLVKHVIGFSSSSFFLGVKSRSASGFLVLIFHNNMTIYYFKCVAFILYFLPNERINLQTRYAFYVYSVFLTQ